MSKISIAVAAFMLLMETIETRVHDGLVRLRAHEVLFSDGQRRNAGSWEW